MMPLAAFSGSPLRRRIEEDRRGGEPLRETDDESEVDEASRVVDAALGARVKEVTMRPPQPVTNYYSQQRLEAGKIRTELLGGRSPPFETLSQNGLGR